MLCLVFDWFEDGLAGLWVACWWFGWFVGSLTGLCVVSRFTANDSKERIQYHHLSLISLEKKVRDAAKFY